MNSQLFSVCSRVLELVGEQCRILVRKPPLLFAFLAVVLAPSLLQAKPYEPTGSGTKGNITLAMDRKAAFKDGISISSARGIGKGDNVGSNDLDKGNSGGSLANLKVVAPVDVTDKTSQQDRASDSVNMGNDELDHWWIYMLIAFWPLLFPGNTDPYGGLKPNAKLTGRTNDD